MDVKPRVLVDDEPADDRILPTAGPGLAALLTCSIVIKSPGISRYSPEAAALEAAGVEVVGGLGLWLEDWGPDRVIGVTGTKGKSTTTSIADHLARRLGARSAAGGNLGLVPWTPTAPDDIDLWVIEISSYQATDLWSSPSVCAVTSLHEDHLTWHDGSAQTYFADKLSLCGRAGRKVTVANGADEGLRSYAGHLEEPVRWVTSATQDTRWTTHLGLRGEHNVLNALIAARCLTELGIAGADDPERLADASSGYQPLPHRLETIAVVNEVEYVDDSLSTNVLPTVVAAEVFEGRPLALLVGGFDRGIDYAPLGDFVARRSAPTLVLALPTNGGRVAEAVTAAGGTSVVSQGIGDAVQRAAKWAPPGGVVLLSPAAASFDLYENYLARSDDFASAVAKLTGDED